MKHAVIGHGEIGKAIEEVLKLKDTNEVYYIDKGLDKNIPPDYLAECLHICMPYTENFIKIVEDYSDRWLQKSIGLVIIHSTVPVGTNKKLNSISSPVRGVHPNIKEGILTFVKYFGSSDLDEATRAGCIFSECGVDVKMVNNAEYCEAAKLWDTTQYGWQIILNKAIHDWCKLNKVSFDFVYTEFNKTYNKGYIKLNRQEVVRSYLKYIEGPIGGHCVIPNLKFLEDSIIANLIKMFDNVEKKMVKENG